MYMILPKQSLQRPVALCAAKKETRRSLRKEMYVRDTKMKWSALCECKTEGRAACVCCEVEGEQRPLEVEAEERRAEKTLGISRGRKPDGYFCAGVRKPFVHGRRESNRKPRIEERSKVEKTSRGHDGLI